MSGWSRHPRRGWIPRQWRTDDERRPEIEQSILRVLIAGIVLAYLAWYVTRTGSPSATEREVLAVAVSFFLFGLAMVYRVLTGAPVSVPRRIVGIVADNAVTSYCLLRMGEGGAAVIGVYLFVTFGNGFRFGRLYLHLSQLLGVLGFTLVLLHSSFWSKQAAVGMGFLIAMLVLPLYVAVLSERIKEAGRRATEANKAKGRFLANMSHEMRTPLNGVIAMADVLRETDLDEAQHEIVETLGTSALLLLAQIEDVLDVSKIEAGRVQIASRPFDLGRLLSTTLKIIVPQARYKGLAVECEIAPDADRWFLGDSHHLRQVLLNLLGNAVKFTQSGHVTLRASRGFTAEGNSLVRFEVEDTGIGIPEEKQSEIFEAFSQADDSITRIYGGTGLGTTIAKQLVALMGGEISVRSTVGQGSTFFFEIPMPESTPSGQNELPDSAQLPKVGFSSVRTTFNGSAVSKIAHLRGARILVAEDNATNRRVTQLILESGGHRPVFVSNGEEALDELEREAFDLALFDLSMPLLSGLEALRAYRFSNRTPIPVIILSANATPEVATECQHAGAAEFVAKPVRASALLDAIDRQLIQPPIAAARDDPAQPSTGGGTTRHSFADVQAVDENVLRDLARLSSDPTFIERLLAGFRSDAERLRSQISEALTNQRYEDLKDVAHALKGGAASVGATRLMAFARRLEELDRHELDADATQLIQELYRNTEDALKALDESSRKRTASQRVH